MRAAEVQPQREALERAVSDLKSVLGDLAQEARFQKAGGHPDLTRLYGLVQALRRAEETYDLADLDLRTAMGEDA